MGVWEIQSATRGRSRACWGPKTPSTRGTGGLAQEFRAVMIVRLSAGVPAMTTSESSLSSQGSSERR